MIETSLLIASMCLSVFALWMNLGTQRMLNDFIREVQNDPGTRVRDREESDGKTYPATQIAVRYVHPHRMWRRHE